MCTGTQSHGHKKGWGKGKGAKTNPNGAIVIASGNGVLVDHTQRIDRVSAPRQSTGKQGSTSSRVGETQAYHRQEKRDRVCVCVCVCERVCMCVK